LHRSQHLLQATSHSPLSPHHFNPPHHPRGSSGQQPKLGDIIVIDYTGYLSNGQIFDATHSVGKNNNLAFKLGDRAVIPGLEDVVSNMYVGDTVQAIIPPELGYGKKGVCIEKEEGGEGECLIKPDSTLVYDVFLKKVSIPPP
jgi:FKBP-type peptidyl-prolyl cis-trans isomerase